MAILIRRRPRRGMCSGSGLALALVAAHFGLGAGRVRAAEPPPDLELQVKAAFVYNFAKFVEWPEDPAHANSPITFCALAGEPFADALEQSLQGRNINGRVVVVKRITKAQQAHRCHVLFLPGIEKKRLEEYLGELAGWSVMTVGDTGQFAARGGMIQLIKDANKFRFAVNVDAVTRVGLKISSRLLQLAEVVHESGGAEKQP